MNDVQIQAPPEVEVNLPTAPAPASPYKYVHDDIRDVSFFAAHAAKKVPVFVRNYGDGPQVDHVLPKSRALINKHSGKRMSDSAVSDSYTLENHEDLYTKHAQIILDRDLPHDNVEVTDEIVHGGLKARRSIKYLNTGRAIGTNVVYCRSDVINSINMSWAFQAFAGAYNSYCENSMVFGGDRAFYTKNKHTRHFNSAALLRTANTVLETYTNHIDKFNAWKSYAIDDETAHQFLKEKLAYYPIPAAEQRAAKVANIKPERKLNLKKFAVLLTLWDQYKIDQGMNLWALYNVLTHYATHTHETYTVDVENKKGEIKTVEHTTGRNLDNATTSPVLNRAYELGTQVERSNDVALIIMQQPFLRPAEYAMSQYQSHA